MGVATLILGESGTGKSASLRNFPQDKVAVINVANKPLPFKNKIRSEATDDYMKVTRAVKSMAADGVKSIVVDDAQYLMANEFMRRATERGYDKFTDIAKNFWSLINMVKELPSDVIVYFLAHIERDQNGNEKIKTIGKLLDEKITVEGMFTIVLKTNVTDGQYYFLTQNNGHDTVKSPIGMFPSYAIDNDLYYVDEKIRNYYEMGHFLTDQEMKELDEMKASDAVKKEDTTEKKGRKRRTSAADDAVAALPVPAPETEVPTEEPPKRSRRRKVSEEMAEERKAVAEENAAALAEAGLDETDSEDGVPFEDVKEPELRKPPRRKKREEQQADAEPAPETEVPTEAETAPARRRRRRA